MCKFEQKTGWVLSRKAIKVRALDIHKFKYSFGWECFKLLVWISLFQNVATQSNFIFLVQQSRWILQVLEPNPFVAH